MLMAVRWLLNTERQLEQIAIEWVEREVIARGWEIT